MDPGRFFVDRGDIKGVAEAKAICRRCPVRVDCQLAATARNEEFGIWGGGGEPIRRELRTIKQIHNGFAAECDCRFCSTVADHFVAS